MADEYVPTTDEVRDFVEMGGDPHPWALPDPEADRARAEAFDRWLAAHDAEVSEAAERRGAIKALRDAADAIMQQECLNADRPARPAHARRPSLLGLARMRAVMSAQDTYDVIDLVVEKRKALGAEDFAAYTVLLLSMPAAGTSCPGRRWSLPLISAPSWTVDDDALLPG